MGNQWTKWLKEYSQDQEKHPYPVTEETTSLSNSGECLESGFVEKSKEAIGEESMPTLPRQQKIHLSSQQLLLY